MATVTFDGRTYEVPKGRDLLGGLLDGGAPISYICMAGSCGTCRCRVTAGADQLAPLDEAERRHFPERDGSVRLACQAVVTGDGPISVSQD